MRKPSFFSLDDEEIKECDGDGLCCPDDLIDEVLMSSLPVLDDAFLEALGVDCSPPPPMNVDAAADRRVNSCGFQYPTPSTKPSLSSMSSREAEPGSASPFQRWDMPTKPRRQPAAARKRPWSYPSMSFGVPAVPAAPGGHGVSADNAGEFGNDSKHTKFSYGSDGGVGGGNLSRLGHVAGELGGGRRRSAGRQRDRPEGLRCGHCHTEKTPQWRNGPDGPSTLCNACGIRFRMGSNKLVPEYRPSTSPFFRSGEHSNRHSKVQKLREKKVKALKLDSDGSSGAPGRQSPPPM